MFTDLLKRLDCNEVGIKRGDFTITTKTIFFICCLYINTKHLRMHYQWKNILLKNNSLLHFDDIITLIHIYIEAQGDALSYALKLTHFLLNLFSERKGVDILYSWVILSNIFIIEMTTKFKLLYKFVLIIKYYVKEYLK